MQKLIYHLKKNMIFVSSSLSSSTFATILLGSLKGNIFIRTFLLVLIKGLRLKVFLVYSLLVV